MPLFRNVNQLDDLDTNKVERAEALSFLTLRVSPGHHRTWMAITESVDLDRQS